MSTQQTALDHYRRHDYVTLRTLTAEEAGDPPDEEAIFEPLSDLLGLIPQPLPTNQPILVVIRQADVLHVMAHPYLSRLIDHVRSLSGGDPPCTP